MRDFDSLTSRGRLRRYRRVLGRALEAYPMAVRSLRFVAYASKPVFRVDGDVGRFAAKFHDAAQHSLSQMIGEMQFLDQISGNSELRVETPVANCRGEFVTAVESDWLPETAHIALCGWLPGSRLKDGVSVRAYGYLGKCAGLLHKISPKFEPRPDFGILTNDEVFYWDEETVLSREDSRLLPRQRQALFRDGFQLAQSGIRELWKSGEPIVIHNDLHPCNLKVCRGSLALYDFEDIAWGFPAQDIGTAMYHVRFRKDFPALLGAFRQAYERVLPWPLESDRQLDRFVIARLLMFANYVVNFEIRPAEHLPHFEAELKSLLGGVAS